MSDVIVINSRTRAELEVLAPVVVNSGRLGLKPVFIRRDNNVALAESTLNSDLKSLKMRLPSHEVMGLKMQSITSAMKSKGYRIGMYLGPEVASLGKSTPKKDIQEEASVKFRYTRICSKCECVLAEIENKVTPEKAKRLENDNIGDEYEIDKSDKHLTIIETAQCRIC